MAHVFYISFVFSNARRVLSQCNIRLRLLSLLTRTSAVQLFIKSQHTAGDELILHVGLILYVIPPKLFLGDS